MRNIVHELSFINIHNFSLASNMTIYQYNSLTDAKDTQKMR